MRPGCGQTMSARTSSSNWASARAIRSTRATSRSCQKFERRASSSKESRCRDVARGALGGHRGSELRQVAAHSPSGVGAIFVYEGLLDDAIAVADSAPYDYAMVEKVADAAIQTHPDWVIRMGRQQAERIMDGGKARYYHHAVDWLKRSRAAAVTISFAAHVVPCSPHALSGRNGWSSIFENGAQG